MQALISLALLAFLLLAPASLSARASAPQRSQAVSARLVTGHDSVRPGDSVLVGLHLRMKPGWHTYWTNPGDSGLATKFAITLNAGTVGPLRWPAPHKIPAGPLMSYGYHDETVLLREIKIPAEFTGKTIEIKAQTNWLECADICLPGKATLSLDLPVGTQNRLDPEHQGLLVRFEKQLPRPMPPGWQWSVKRNGPRYEVRLSGASGAEFEHFFPAPGVTIAHPAVQSARSQDGVLHLQLEQDSALPPAQAISGVLRLRGEHGPVSYEVAPRAAASLVEVLSALLLAFAGGLILNLMPCVLPVLSIKVQSLMSRAGQSRSVSLAHGLVLAAGVLVSFWAVAIAMLVARAGGQELGWGFQLQSPGMVVALAAVMLLFALNMLGVFEVGTRLQSAGSNSHKDGLGASFMTGVLAVVVAAPCTAPFMGAALGFALVAPAWIALGVFTALGLGLAAPYILLSAFPNATRILPKPGAWMETLKQFMGFLLVGAVAWLVWILGRLAGVDAIGLALGCLLLLAVSAWLYGRVLQRGPTGRTRRILALVSALLFLGGALLLGARAAQAKAAANTAVPKNGLIDWQPYSPEDIAAARRSGKNVFLDFTADWCLSCKVNEQVVLETNTIRDAFEKHSVLAMRADWTRNDPQITAAIRALGRTGVPLYVIYAADATAPPVLLPEVLTTGIVLDALRALKKPQP